MVRALGEPKCEEDAMERLRLRRTAAELIVDALEATDPAERNRLFAEAWALIAEAWALIKRADREYGCEPLVDEEIC
jgi:hypothetical protein